MFLVPSPKQQGSMGNVVKCFTTNTAQFNFRLNIIDNVVQVINLYYTKITAIRDLKHLIFH